MKTSSATATSPTGNHQSFLSHFARDVEIPFEALVTRADRFGEAEAGVRTAAEEFVYITSQSGVSRFVVETEQEKLYDALAALSLEVKQLRAAVRVCQDNQMVFATNALLAISESTQTTPFVSRTQLEPLVVVLNVDNPTLPPNASPAPACEMRRVVKYF